MAGGGGNVKDALATTSPVILVVTEHVIIAVLAPALLVVAVM
jgi:uncharacterized membrane protein YeiH